MRFVITIDGSDEYANAEAPIDFNEAGDSNETDESDLQTTKHINPSDST
jgi:hypothetical protein